MKHSEAEHQHGLIRQTPPGVEPVLAMCPTCGDRFMLRDGEWVIRNSLGLPHVKFKLRETASIDADEHGFTFRDSQGNPIMWAPSDIIEAVRNAVVYRGPLGALRPV